MKHTGPKQNGVSRKRLHDEPESFFPWFPDDSDAIADEPAEVIEDNTWPNPWPRYFVLDMDDEGGEEEVGGDEDTDEGEEDESEGDEEKNEGR